MRISTGQMNQALVQSLQRNDVAYAKVLEQMSTGNRINKMSDDALGSTRIIGLEREEKSLDQWSKNIEQLNSKLDRNESYLDSSFNVILRMQDLLLTARTDSATQKDREAIVSELENLQKSLVDFANAKDESGDHIFSGSRIDVPPVLDTGAGYVYQGDNVERNVPVAQGVEINSNITVDEVYFNGGNFFDEIQAVIDDINSGSATIGTTASAALTGIDRTIDGLGSAISKIGARINTADTIFESQQDLSLNNQKIVGQIRDLDYVEAISRVNEIETALSTTQKTFAKLSQQTLFNYL